MDYTVDRRVKRRLKKISGLTAATLQYHHLLTQRLLNTAAATAEEIAALDGAETALLAECAKLTVADE